MILLNPIQARHFCAPLATHVPGQGQSLGDLHNRIRATRLSEGQPNFSTHRVSMLNAVERWMLFGTAHYRRSLDMFIPATTPWAQVTLYYASFFAANALLGMFGVWIGQSQLIDVECGVPNQQVLKVRRNVRRGPTGLSGSHRLFWDFFYEACSSLSPWVPNRMRGVMTPVNNDRTWQIKERNAVNYDTSRAHEAALRFQQSFQPKKKRPRTTLTGAIRQQLEVTEQMLKLAFHFANKFQVQSFALDGFGVPGHRSRVIRAVATKVPPSLVNQSILQDLLA